MAINTELSVSGLGEFKSAFSQAQNAVKTLDAELKKNEAQYKNTGDKEAYLIEKQKLLQQQLKLQKSAADQARAALKQLDANGVNPMSKSYQDLAQKLAKAETAILETNGALDQLKQGEMEAASGADQLTTSVNGISKKISLDQVIGGIDKITGGLENAAKKAVDLGKQLFNTIMESARWADDTATIADMYGIPLDRFLRMQQLVTGGMDTSVDAMLAAQDKLKRGIGNDTDKIIGFLKDLGLARTVAGGKTDASYTELVSDDEIDMFWRAGQALMNMSDAYDKEAAASALFGKSWKELVPLFTEYKSLEEYNAALDEQTVNSEGTVRSLAELNDAVSKLEGSWQVLKTEVLGALAPALENGAEAISGLLDSLTEYLKSEDGKKMLEDLGTAVSGLFEDLGKIDPGQVVSGFTSVFTTITDGLKWLLENKNALGDVLVGIVTAWAGAKLTGGALQVLQLVNGVKDLAGGGAAAAGGAAGASWGSAFAAAVLKAAPWITFLYGTLKPGETVDNSLADATGNLTQEGWSDFYDQRRRASNGQTQDNVWYDLIMEAGEIVNGAAALWDDFDGINALARYANSRDRGQLADDLAALGYTLRLTDEELMADIPSGGSTNVESTGGLIHKDRRTGEPIVEVDPVVPEDAAGLISQQIGSVPVSITIRDVMGAELESLVGGGSHANGLPWVPYDGYLSVLHRGERVMTASENRSYTYNSNTYFGNVNLNNGLEVEALTESIARNNRRKNSGYGA